jgi:hypothetical protein
MKNELSDFDNRLMNGLVFCKKAYALFEGIRSSPDGIARLRLRKGRLEKKLIEELLPIARFIQARYNHGRQIKVRWIDGNQSYDGQLLSRGALVDKGYAHRKQTIEVTTAVHEKEHNSRRYLHEHGHTFGPKGMKNDSLTKKYISQPHVYTNYEAEEDLTAKILESIKAKNNKKYPQLTTLIIQCFLDTLFIEDEWEYAIQKLKDSLIVHKFYEIFIFDSNHHYSATIYGGSDSSSIGKSAHEAH